MHSVIGRIKLKQGREEEALLGGLWLVRFGKT
jgi:hypothetical protein